MLGKEKNQPKCENSLKEDNKLEKSDQNVKSSCRKINFTNKK